MWEPRVGFIAIVFSAFFTLVLPSVEAQKLKVSSVAMIDDKGDGMVSLTPKTGETVSKKGVRVKYGLVLDKDEKPIAYSLAESDAKSLKSGDKIAIFIRDLHYASSTPFSQPADDSILSELSYPTLDGAWKVVTIESINQAGDEVEVTVKETLKFKDGQTASQLRFVSKQGLLIDARTPGVRPEQTPSAAAAITPVETSANPATPESSRSFPVWIVVIGGGLLLVAVGVIVMISKRRSAESRT